MVQVAIEQMSQCAEISQQLVDRSTGFMVSIFLSVLSLIQSFILQFLYISDQEYQGDAEKVQYKAVSTLIQTDQKFQVDDWRVIVRDRCDIGSWTSKHMFIFRYLQDTQEFGFWLDLVACSGTVWAILVDTLVVLHSFCGGLSHILYNRGSMVSSGNMLHTKQLADIF